MIWTDSLYELKLLLQEWMSTIHDTLFSSQNIGNQIEPCAFQKWMTTMKVFSIWSSIIVEDFFCHCKHSLKYLCPLFIYLRYSREDNTALKLSGFIYLRSYSQEMAKIKFEISVSDAKTYFLSFFSVFWSHLI